MHLEAFNKKFNIPELLIYHTSLWQWSVRANHCTLGATVLSLRRDCSTFGALTQEEAAELGKMFHLVECVTKKSFSNDKVNYLALMMVDQHVHYHVIPRYSNVVEFGGRYWSDPAWPAGLPNLKNHPDILPSDPMLLSVRNVLKDNIE